MTVNVTSVGLFVLVECAERTMWSFEEHKRKKKKKKKREKNIQRHTQREKAKENEKKNVGNNSNETFRLNK